MSPQSYHDQKNIPDYTESILYSTWPFYPCVRVLINPPSLPLSNQNEKPHSSLT